MKKQILIVTAAALTAAVVVLNGTSAATAQQTPQYQVGGFPITPHQMLVLQPSAKISEQQRLNRQPTMDASRGARVRDFGIGGNATSPQGIMTAAGAFCGLPCELRTRCSMQSI
jgi:hypothetical protein